MTSFWTHMGKTIKWNHCDNPSEGSISRIRKFTSNLQNKTKQMLYILSLYTGKAQREIRSHLLFWDSGGIPYFS